jgi:hypothetical protein
MGWHGPGARAWLTRPHPGAQRHGRQLPCGGSLGADRPRDGSNGPCSTAVPSKALAVQAPHSDSRAPPLTPSGTSGNSPARRPVHVGPLGVRDRDGTPGPGPGSTRRVSAPGHAGRLPGAGPTASGSAGRLDGGCSLPGGLLVPSGRLARVARPSGRAKGFAHGPGSGATAARPGVRPCDNRPAGQPAPARPPGVPHKPVDADRHSGRASAPGTAGHPGEIPGRTPATSAAGRPPRRYSHPLSRATRTASVRLRAVSFWMAVER